MELWTETHVVSDEIGSTMGGTDLRYERMRQESEVYCARTCLVAERWQVQKQEGTHVCSFKPPSTLPVTADTGNAYRTLGFDLYRMDSKYTDAE